MIEIGIIGLGYVGTAVLNKMSKKYRCHTYDVKKQSTSDNIKVLVELSDIIFICVPTPMNGDGSCNLDIVEKVIAHHISNGGVSRFEKFKLIGGLISKLCISESG